MIRIIKPVLALLSLLTLGVAHAFPPTKTFELVHQNAEITLDGELEASWKNATRIAIGYQDEPNEKAKPPVKTDAYLFEDGEYLYAAFVAEDAEPQQIRGALRDRDALWQDDFVALFIDTFNDERSGYGFYVNPFGAQGDTRMTDVDGWVNDPSWDGIWQSVGVINANGYVVEMRIPLSALRLPDTRGAMTWGISVQRNYPREVLYELSSVGYERDIKCSFCQFDKLTGLADLKQSANLQLTPHLTVARNDVKPDDRWLNGDVEAEPGLDLRWRVSQDSVLNATLNPDFSQVEADAAQLDVNTAFSLYYLEKRPFFLDGASYFDTEQFELFYSRTIAEPNYGLKWTGKTNGHSYGVVVADDQNTSVVVPGKFYSSLAYLGNDSDALVGRYQMDVGERNHLGVMTTHRQGEDNYRNSLISVDGSYWFGTNDSVQYQLAWSDTENSDLLMDYTQKRMQRDHAFKVGYSRATGDHALYASYEDVGEDFRADLGYKAQVDFRKLEIGGGQTWYGNEGSRLTQWSYDINWDKTYDQGGTKLEEEYDASFALEGHLQSRFSLGYVHRSKNYFGEFYNQNRVYSSSGFQPHKDVRFTLWAAYGSDIDYANGRPGTELEIEPELSWDINGHWQVKLFHSYNRLDAEGERVFTANLTDFRVNYKFDMRSMVKLILQFEDVDRNPEAYYYYRVNKINRSYGSQLVYSYKINPQTLFYLGYSDAGFQDDSLDGLTRDRRSFFTKLSYAWQL